MPIQYGPRHAFIHSPIKEPGVMTETIDDLTMRYEEDGTLLVKETGKEILTRGSWTTILFRYQELNKSTGEFSEDKYAIRRYQKRGGQYVQKSKFAISNRAQAQKIVETLTGWLQD
jgi:hypothetical protein